ncbi:MULTISPECIES: 5-dehydro-4-deoxyglucarate dehydratase [Brevibacterium]|uniref:Probable 5-dehydro-4-deoxyglucarate dehydratase n=1 Tax=Brevibacterium sediminis TaxID=1857024 RepID=A0A5C4X5N5_9MICO|nr:5-dehydro-4-deoxyglucarate dehydratase [Brevibacterium sediminis]MCS4594172.1 5-dehydro-4-deoxyglucarate dehydratase [Brevibacterium sediminis]TNM57055.1 5-dehydro-4-deoxyglucarate dehydratase [Brevibacterium sediminis]
MANYQPQELADHLKDGLLSFPATAFNADLSLDADAYSDHITWQSSFDVAGLFAAGGTGEGFSLTPPEAKQVVGLAVSNSRTEVPVLASAGGATAHAVQNAIDAEEAGAEGLLALPPYLTECSQDGLFEHVSAICKATKIGVIVYNRANAIYSPETVERLADTHENFIGFKDALGDIEQLTKVYARTGDRLFYLGGLPTAEVYALPLLQLGMSTYSSAMFNFAPEFALDFYDAVRKQDRAAVTEKLNSFVLPYSKIRERVAGYGVSIVKGGLKVIGRDCGPVRPPLQNLTEADLQDLEQVMSAAGIRLDRTASAVA